MTFPSVVSFAHGNNPTVFGTGGVTSHTVTLPSGSAGDLLMACVSLGNSVVAMTWPAGWTAPSGVAATYSSGDGRIEVRYRVADGTEGSSITITTGTTCTSAFHVYRLTDYTGAPTGASNIGGLVAACDPPSLTSGFGAVDTLWLAIGGWANGQRGITAYPSSYTNGTWDSLAETTASAAIASARRTLNAASEDPGAFTIASSGAWNVGLTLAIEGATTPPLPIGIEFDGSSFVDVSGDVMEWTITRGSGPELTGGSQAGSATIVLRNIAPTSPDDKYNPENASGPYYGLLHDGPRVWLAVNEDGTVTPDAGKTVYGLFAGRITDLSVMPVGGASVAPTVELVCEDPLGWFGRAQVTVSDDTTRSQYQLRQAVLDVLDPAGNRSLEPEPATLPLSSADGLGLNILDAINAANGTRHFAKPADTLADWYTYTTIRRTSRLDGTAEASADAGTEHVTGTTGWRVSADGVINRQKASVEPITFPVRRLVWQSDTLPLTVVSGTPLVVWADFGDYVADPVIDSTHTGSSATFVIEPFGKTAKVTITSSGTTTVTLLDIQGNLVQRGSTESVVIDDLTSQGLSRGVRAGPDLSGDYLGTLTSAKGFAQHIVWRFGNALYRPTMTVENWFPTMFDLDLYDRISLTVAELSITDRIFEIVGLTLHSDLAALDGSTPVVHHTATYTLQESRVQTATQWFMTDVSTSDGPDLLAY